MTNILPGSRPCWRPRSPGGRSLADVEFDPPPDEFLTRSAEPFVVVAPWGAGKSLLVQELKILSAFGHGRQGPVAVNLPI